MSSPAARAHAALRLTKSMRNTLYAKKKETETETKQEVGGNAHAQPRPLAHADKCLPTHAGLRLAKLVFTCLTL